MHEDKDAIIGPAIKVIDSLSLLPSQAAEQYMVDFAKDTIDIVESNVLLNKLAEKVVKKQDSGFWLYTLQKIPQIVDLIGDIGVKISSVEVLSFAQSCVEVSGINYMHVKDVLKALLPEASDKKFAQNILLQIDVKIGNEDEMLEDVDQYQDAVTLSVANLCVENRMFKAASIIFKHLKNHVDAVSCLLDNKLYDEAEAYAKDVQDVNSWRVIAKHYMESDQEKSYNALKSTN